MPLTWLHHRTTSTLRTESTARRRALAASLASAMTCEHGWWMRPLASEERCGVGNGPRSPDRRNGNRSRMPGVAYTIDAGWGRWRNPISKRRGFDSRTDCMAERGVTPAIPQGSSRKPVSTVGMCARPAWPITSIRTTRATRACDADSPCGPTPSHRWASQGRHEALPKILSAAALARAACAGGTDE